MQCTEDGCEQPARFEYAWPWSGGGGRCCAKHQYTVNQTAENLGRAGQVQFIPITGAEPEPISRDERVRFHAQILTLEDELRESRAKGLQLYNSNTAIAEQARRYASRIGEFEAQLKDARSDVESAHAERDQYLDQVAELRAELETLKAILPPAPADDDEEPPPATP